MRWVVFFSLVVVTGCQKPCNPSTCDGCCTDLEECTTGSARTTCGRGGAQCVSCGQTERCEQSRCVKQVTVDAGPSVDAGPMGCTCATSCCLEDGTCGPSNETACGLPRQPCAPCPSGQRCESGRCTATSCSGCLDALGTCRGGRDDVACGSSGALCVSCSTDQVCVLGACQYRGCDMSNCRFGCCQPNGRCETQIGAAACGFNASACATCRDGGLCIGGLCSN